MRLEDYFDFSDPRDIRIQGHRVWIQHILHPYLNEGKSPEQIAQDLPTLSLDKIYATILYYLLNKEAVTQYLSDLDAAMEAARAAQPPPRPDFAARYERAKAEWEARRKAASEPQVPAR
jgi:uncharacterized protein (DUF433 family)